MNLITTYTGKQIDIFNLQLEDICIQDIAHSLSLQCRAMGHLDRFYSVAEHCYWLSLVVPPELSLEALLHDASEAYITDIPTPIKDAIPQIRTVEKYIQGTISEAFNLSSNYNQLIKKWDREMFIKETQFCFTEFDSRDIRIKEIDSLELIGMKPTQIEKLFLARYKELIDGR